MVLVELNRVLFYGQDQDGVLESLENLSDNIQFLRLGGISSQIETSPLPARFSVDWSGIWEKFLQYETGISAVMEQDDVNYLDIEGVEQTSREQRPCRQITRTLILRMTLKTSLRTR